MNKINQSYSINDLSAIKLEDLPSLNFKDRLNRIKQNIKYRYLPFRLYSRLHFFYLRNYK